MNWTTLLTAALIGILISSPTSAMEGIATPLGCSVEVSSIEAQLAVSRLARMRAKAKNFSPRRTHQFELSSTAPLPWRLADSAELRTATSVPVCTRCER